MLRNWRVRKLAQKRNREVKIQQTELEMAARNEENKKDIPILATIEAATALVATRIITSSETNLIVRMSTVAEAVSSRNIELSGILIRLPNNGTRVSRNGFPSAAAASSSSVPGHVEGCFLRFVLCESIQSERVSNRM